MPLPMPQFLRRFMQPAQPERMSAGRGQNFEVVIPPELMQAMTGGGTIAPRVSRAMALQVPAVLRARNLICGSLSTLPLGVWGPDKRQVPLVSTADGRAVTYLAPNPDPELPQCVVLAETYEDLLFEGVSWWRVTKFGWHGFPVEARHVPHSSVFVAPAGGLLPSQQRVTPDQSIPVEGTVYIDGYPVPDREIIRFDSPNPPLLVAAARAIRTCLQLEITASLYIKDPLPLGYFSPADGAEDIEDQEAQDLLDEWEAQRAKRATGYVPKSLKFNSLQWDAKQLQLVEQRQAARLEIALAAGLDPEDLGVSTTSRTYANREQRNQDKINFTLGGYASAVQERLSMRDILPRGYETRVDFAGFLRGDALTRMQTAEIGLRVGAFADEDEVRDSEGKPPLTPAQRAKRTQAKSAPAPAAPAEPEQAQQERREVPVKGTVARFASDTETTVRVQFDALSTSDFQVDTSRRTITGLLLPWGKVANNGWAKWRFKEGSLSWSDTSRIKLDLHHDRTELIGVATRLQSASRGLMGTFKVGRGPAADKALADAEDGIMDGFSVEVEFEDIDSWQIDPTDESVRLVNSGTLRGVALTGTPAFDDARLTSVKATRDGGKDTGMTAPTKAATGQPAQPQNFDFGEFVGGLADAMKETQTKLVEGLAETVGESLSAGIKVALEGMTSPQDGPQPVRAARYTVTREAPVYSLNGAGPSLVRDGWYAAMNHDEDAKERLRKFRAQTEDLAKLSHAEIRNRQNFATITTGTASQVIPPGYRPDLFVPQLAQGRPMVNALSRGVIENATPFVVPTFTSVTGATGDHVEGVNPTDGTLTLGTKTVTPGAVSGKLILTREIVDSSNPAIDQIALNSMMESYNQQTETKVYTLLNGANGAGGVITAGFVPSGAQAATFASTGGTPFAEAALIKGVRQQLAKYPFARFASPSRGFMGQNATSIIAGTMDSTGRPIFPSVGAQNSIGTGNSVTQGWNIDGLLFVPAWAMTGQTAGDSQMMMLNELDAWAWESPLLTFRYEEKSGPALIELVLFGYFATHLLRPRGLSGIRIT